MKPKAFVEKKKDEKKQNVPVFTKKENATLEQCITILDWHHKNKTKQKATGSF